MRTMMMSRWFACALLGFMLLWCASCGQDRTRPNQKSATSATNPFRVALLLTGPVSDDGWNASAQEGLLAIEREVGAQTAIVESLDKSKFEENFRQFAGQGYNLILGHAYEFQDAALQVGPEFPKTTFLIVAGNSSSANVGSVHFRLEDATYVLGALAAKMSKSGRGGLVGGEEIPSLKPGFDGFIAGAKSINPNYEVITKYVGNWNDVGTARELAEALIAQGADAIFQNADKAGLGVFQAAAAHPGVYAFGSNKDQNGVVPEVVLASAVIDVPAAFVRLAKAVKAGEYVPKAETMGTKEGVVTVTVNRTLMSALPPEINAFVEDLRKKIETGEIMALPQPS